MLYNKVIMTDHDCHVYVALNGIREHVKGKLKHTEITEKKIK